MTVELDAKMDVAGFRHVATSTGDRLGATRIGVGVYAGDAGHPIWLYHYHHGIEEWLLVLSGAPVLREPAGRQKLAAGDLVCFPSGPTGAHTVEGPGRFLIFSTGQEHEPRGTVYVDSNKMSSIEGLVPLDTIAGYFYREGTGEVDPELQNRVPTILDRPARPVVNVASIKVESRFKDVPSGFRSRSMMLGPLLGAKQMGATVAELDPGEGSAPYHYECGREEWVLVLAGTPTLRHPGGEDLLDAGDVVVSPTGRCSAGQASSSLMIASTIGRSSVAIWVGVCPAAVPWPARSVIV